MEHVRERIAIAATAMVLTFGVSAADKLLTDKKADGPDTAFVMQAAQDGHAEVELGKLAQKNASSATVREFGARMVKDHGKANDELASIAKKLGMKVPTEPGDKHKAVAKKLSELKGEKFDAEYASEMVQAHENAVTLFQKQAKVGEAAELKAFASKTLPTLEEHLKMARSLKDQKK